MRRTSDGGSATTTTRDRRAVGSLTALLAAHAVSQTGNVVAAFAVPFFVLGLGGSGVEVGVAAFFATAPVVVGGALGGVVVDRVGHRRASVVADLVSGLTVLAIPTVALTVGLPFWALLVLVFAGGLLDTRGRRPAASCCPASPSGPASRSSRAWASSTGRSASPSSSAPRSRACSSPRSGLSRTVRHRRDVRRVGGAHGGVRARSRPRRPGDERRR